MAANFKKMVLIPYADFLKYSSCDKETKKTVIHPHQIGMGYPPGIPAQEFNELKRGLQSYKSTPAHLTKDAIVNDSEWAINWIALDD